MTVAEMNEMTGVEKAMAQDILDADGIDRLTEDENPWFTEGLDTEPMWAGDLSEDEAFFWNNSIHNEG